MDVGPRCDSHTGSVDRCLARLERGHLSQADDSRTASVRARLRCLCAPRADHVSDAIDGVETQLSPHLQSDGVTTVCPSMC